MNKYSSKQANIIISSQDAWCRNEWCDQAYHCWGDGAVKCCFTEPTSPDCSVRRSCFPSTAKINLENGKSVRMAELQVGDRVQTGM